MKLVWLLEKETKESSNIDKHLQGCTYMFIMICMAESIPFPGIGLNIFRQILDLRLISLNNTMQPPLLASLVQTVQE